MSDTATQTQLEHAPGSFCWIELATTDGPGAKKFYSELFGWEAQDSPVGPDMVYTMLKLDGKDVGALFQKGEAMKQVPGLTTKTPKPRNSMRSPFCNALFIASNKASTAISAFIFGTPVLSETSFTMSSLITIASILHCDSFYC